jgi:hypothetical protein
MMRYDERNKEKEETTMATTINGDGKWMLNEYNTYRELARKADKTAMDDDPAADKVSITMRGGFHIEADFTKPATVVSVKEGCHDYTHPLDSTPEYQKVSYYTRRTYEDSGASLKVTRDSANTMHNDNKSSDVRDASVELYTSTTTCFVDKKTGDITDQTTEEEKFIIPDYLERNRKPASWYDR